MKYFSEKDGFVNAECESCKRVLRIRCEQTIPNDTGFSLTPPDGVRCFCGAIHHSITGTTQDPSVWQSGSSGSKNQQKSPTDLRWFYYDHETHGPLSFEDIKKQYSSRNITGDTLVWHTDNNEPMIALKKSEIAKYLKDTPVPSKARGLIKLLVYLLLIIVAAITFFGNFHIIVGGFRGPKIVSRESFGISEVFIDIEAITSMPWSSAKSRFPLGCHVLQREYAGFIDSTGQFVEWSPERTPIHIDIITYAQMLVEKQLKAPSTAKHPWGSQNYQIEELGDNRYSVSSYVDSQNSFGAMIRTTYTIVIREAGDRWLLESIKTNP